MWIWNLYINIYIHIWITIHKKKATPCILTLCPWAESPVQTGYRPHYSPKVRFSQIILPLVEPRSGVTLTCIQKVFAGWAVAARSPGHQVSLTVHRSHGISCDPVIAIGDGVSCYMLIFPTASIKLCFITCCQTLLLFSSQKATYFNVFAPCKEFTDVMHTRQLEKSFLFQKQILFPFWHLVVSMYSGLLVQGLRQLKAL